jgi:hypothetical protein
VLEQSAPCGVTTQRPRVVPSPQDGVLDVHRVQTHRTPLPQVMLLLDQQRGEHSQNNSHQLLVVVVWGLRSARGRESRTVVIYVAQ